MRTSPSGLLVCIAEKVGTAGRNRDKPEASPLHTVERPTLLRFRPQVADVMHAMAEMYAARAHEQAKAAEVFGEGTVKPKTDPTSRPLDPAASSFRERRRYA